MPGIVITGLYRLSNGSVSVPLRSDGSTQIPLWSEDASSYICLAFSPVGSRWAEEDERAHKTFTSEGLHVFWVRPTTGEIKQIPAQITDTRDRAFLFWSGHTDRTGSD